MTQMKCNGQGFLIEALEGVKTGNKMPEELRPPICDYEGSDYQTRFWDKGGREYEDRCESIALQRLLPKSGGVLLELGAGAGRNTPRYPGFEHIFLVDYSRSQLRLAQEQLGESDRFVYVAADIYRLPFVDGLFDAATMIRVLHHMADAPAALMQVRKVLRPGAYFILEYANKHNLKAILRYTFRRQSWNPFLPESIELSPLNFDFHPRTLHKLLNDLGFQIERTLTVSHFRVNLLKKIIPPKLLAAIDSVFQWTGAFAQFSPSVFFRAKVQGKSSVSEFRGDFLSFFKCPECGHSPLDLENEKIICPLCKREWNISAGIFDFLGNK